MSKCNIQKCRIAKAMDNTNIDKINFGFMYIYIIHTL